MNIRDFLIPEVEIPVAVVVFLLVPALWLAARKQHASDRELLGNWANESGYRIVNARRRYFFIGPLTWRYAYGMGFKVEVLTSTGERRSGWLVFYYGRGWTRMARGPRKFDVAWSGLPSDA
jgi:hypothetical protein